MATGNVTVARYSNVERPNATGWVSYLDGKPCSHKHRSDDAAETCGSKRAAEARAAAIISREEATEILDFDPARLILDGELMATPGSFGQRFQRADVEALALALRAQAPEPEERTYYSHEEGEITCVEHAGFYLSQSIQMAPGRKSYRTPLGTWWSMSPEEIATYRYAVRDLPGWSEHICESCRAKAEEPRDAGEAEVSEADLLEDFLENDLSDAEFAEIDSALDVAVASRGAAQKAIV